MKNIIESYRIANRRNDRISHLSGGQQRKVAVIRWIASRNGI